MLLSDVVAVRQLRNARDRSANAARMRSANAGRNVQQRASAAVTGHRVTIVLRKRAGQ